MDAAGSAERVVARHSADGMSVGARRRSCPTTSPIASAALPSKSSTAGSSACSPPSPSTSSWGRRTRGQSRTRSAGGRRRIGGEFADLGAQVCGTTCARSGTGRDDGGGHVPPASHPPQGHLRHLPPHRRPALSLAARRRAEPALHLPARDQRGGVRRRGARRDRHVDALPSRRDRAGRERERLHAPARHADGEGAAGPAAVRAGRRLGAGRAQHRRAEDDRGRGRANRVRDHEPGQSGARVRGRANGRA